jgi:hypothetical protein
MSKEIEIIIDKGIVTVDQIGYQGSACENALQGMFEQLGQVRTQDKKDEYYQKRVSNVQQYD